MTVFVCEDSLEGILCGAYAAFGSGLAESEMELELRNTGNLRMFADYVETEPDREKSDRMIDAVRLRISEDAYMCISRASLSCDESKADLIFRFLIQGFHYGRRIMNMLQLKEVYEIFRMDRAVGNEAHLLLGFTRFSQMRRGVLLSRIGPKNDVTGLIAQHFADRLSGENWVIYDENRKKAAVHQANGPWAMLDVDLREWQQILEEGTDEKAYQDLWNEFFHSVAIRERTNPRCQRGHLPLRYRSYMTEFR